MRRAVTALLAALLGVACGGGGGTTGPSSAPPAGEGDRKLVVLDTANFDAFVLAAPRPSLVKFQSPT